MFFIGILFFIDFLGVKLRKGDNDVEIFVKYVVFDVGVVNTFFYFLLKEVVIKLCKL